MNNLLNELMTIEEQIDDLTEIVEGIRAQMTALISKKKLITSDEQEWLDRAGVALHINKAKLRKLNVKRDRLNRAIKSEKKQYAQNRWQLKNSLFHEKLKELMPEEELELFLTECYRKIDEEFPVQKGGK